VDRTARAEPLGAPRPEQCLVGALVCLRRGAAQERVGHGHPTFEHRVPHQGAVERAARRFEVAAALRLAALLEEPVHLRQSQLVEATKQLASHALPGPLLRRPLADGLFIALAQRPQRRVTEPSQGLAGRAARQPELAARVGDEQVGGVQAA
jgi:hypothetical protein